MDKVKIFYGNKISRWKIISEIIANFNTKIFCQRQPLFNAENLFSINLFTFLKIKNSPYIHWQL